MFLHMDECFDAIALDETFNQTLAVLVHPPCEIIGNAGIKCPVSPAREDVDVIGMDMYRYASCRYACVRARKRCSGRSADQTRRWAASMCGRACARAFATSS